MYRKLEVIPAVFEVHEHHIEVYKGKNGKIVKGKHPREMLENSIATPSLVAGIINGKYTNAVPLYRQEQEFARNDVNISRQTMSGWVITTAERYLSLVYDRLKEEIIKSSVVHADETPVTVQKTRKANAPEAFLKGFEGKLVCDGYQAYHTLENRPDT